jgi:tetratricopeptide (TPR) repeat protein
VEMMREIASGIELAAAPGHSPAGGLAPGAPLTKLPPRLIAVIQGRLDLLSAGARDLAGVAAVCGRAFSYELLASACDQDDSILAGNLDELWRRHLVREQGATAYDFSHDAIREVAYAAVGPARRRALHARIAQAIERVHAHDLDVMSAQLAAHYHQAGMAQQAIPWYQRAASAAEARFDYTQAAEWLDAALVLLASLPATGARNNLECTLLLAEIASLRVVEGFTGPQVTKAFKRVEALVTDLQDDGLRYQALRDLRGYSCAIGAMDVAYEQAETLLDLALRLEESDYLVEAYNALGAVCRYMGRLPQARQHLERAGDLCPDGMSPNILINLALTLWLLGYADDARRMMAGAVDAVQSPTSLFSQNPFAQNIVYFFASILYRHLKDVTSVADLTDRLLELGQRYDIRTATVDGANSKAWVAAISGDPDAGIPRMRAGIDEYLAMNHRMFQPQRLAFLSDAQLRAHAYSAASATIDEALALSRRTGELGWDADLYRQKAELLAATGAPHDEILGTYEHAIATAQAQAAKALELRATTGLCRYLHSLGRTAEAVQRLAPLYAWFKQGHDTPDLVEAGLLLNTLSV